MQPQQFQAVVIGVVLVAFTTVVGAIFGAPLIGAAAGLALVLAVNA